MKYPKINTIWKRDKKTHKIIDRDFSCPEFENIFMWRVTEKIDGTNIRVIFHRRIEPLYDGSPWQVTDVKFEGRTDNAEIPKHLIEYLEKIFPVEKFKKNFPYSLLNYKSEKFLPQIINLLLIH